MSRFLARDGNHAPKWPYEIDQENPLSRELAFALTFPKKGVHRDVSPHGLRPIGYTNWSSVTEIEGAGLGKHGLKFANVNSKFDLDTGGAGILATAKDSSLFAWVEGLTAANREMAANTVYAERPSATPIWKFVAGRINPPNESKWGFTHRNNAGTLSQCAAAATIEDGGLHLIGLTKRGTAVRLYRDGRLDSTHSLSGNDTLGVDDPQFFWDDKGSGTTTERFRATCYGVFGWKRTLGDAEVRSLWHPATRWSLFREVPRQAWFVPPPPVSGLPIPVAVHHLRQQGIAR